MTASLTIVLSNLRAEGGPALAADLCACWQETGIAPRLVLLNDDRMEMAPRFEALAKGVFQRYYASQILKSE